MCVTGTRELCMCNSNRNEPARFDLATTNWRNKYNLIKSTYLFQGCLSQTLWEQNEKLDVQYIAEL